MEAKGSQWQGDCREAISEGGWRQKAWVDVQVCPVPIGRGQADEAGESGTSPQHRIKSSIHHGKLRTSDDRALKVAEVHPGRPTASRYYICVKLTGIGKAGILNFPGVGGRSCPDRQRAKLCEERKLRMKGYDGS